MRLSPFEASEVFAKIRLSIAVSANIACGFLTHRDMESNGKRPQAEASVNDAAAERRPPVRKGVHPVDAYFLNYTNRQPRRKC